MNYIERSETVGRIDTQHQKKLDYRERIVVVMKFLSPRRLPFRYDNVIIGSLDNRKYL